MPSIVERIEQHARDRKSITVQLKDFLASDVEGAIRLRALNVSEESEATREAVEYQRSVLAQLPEKFVREFLDDPTFLADARSVAMLHRACIAIDSDEHAFPSAQWMRENMTHEELQILWGWYMKALAMASRTQEPIDLDRVMVLTYAAAANPFNEVTDALLMALEKPVLADAFVRLSVEFAKVVKPPALA